MWARAKKANIEKKNRIKEPNKAKNSTKALWVNANPWAFLFNMKNLLFSKIYY